MCVLFFCPKTMLYAFQITPVFQRPKQFKYLSKSSSGVSVAFVSFSCIEAACKLLVLSLERGNQR